MKTALRSLLALLAFCVTLGACSSPFESTDVDIVTLEIDSQLVPCMAMIPTTCMRVREDPSDSWGLFYREIEGFTYEPGFIYKVQVEVREIKNPPADGSSAAYRLLRLIEKRPVAASL
ncbi:DUF4377 domain-containing protein [Longimicrobium terrae]|uniref:DUF4377 domain-containing protein n=1 Tax=Longimicrobium terrae TaxID=1639882 RepID=A0A841GVJ7_9BACT|nr:DUF4377 domain-containing protein [Longimicrobium terrae]MBB4634989.1 hypothetical protein [Longimicrobium terrae]MBB6069383.1 hypothetical protein [Longimicrobium terrae]NNC31811.1 DUF4377 domain-containing protein [Longimicrobium terrae]